MRTPFTVGCVSLVVLALLAPGPAHAQSLDAPSDPSRVRVGLLVGLGVNQSLGRECTVSCDFDLLGDPSANFVSGEKFLGGAFLAYALNPLYSLRVEARFVVKGVKAQHLGGATVFLDGEPVDTALFYTLDHSLRYIQVPVLVQREIAYDSRIRPHLLAGVAVGYLVDARASGTGSLIDEFNRDLGTATGEANYGDATKDWDIAAMVGAGVTFPLWRGDLEFGARYEFSALSALDGLFTTSLESEDTEIYQPGTTSPDPAAIVDTAPLTAENMRHHVISLTLGYLF